MTLLARYGLRGKRRTPGYAVTGGGRLNEPDRLFEAKEKKCSCSCH